MLMLLGHTDSAFLFLLHNYFMPKRPLSYSSSRLQGRTALCTSLLAPFVCGSTSGCFSFFESLAALGMQSFGVCA